MMQASSNKLNKLKNYKLTMSLNIKLIAGSKTRFVIVEPAPAETKTASGIYIPETAQEKPQKGTVIEIAAEDEDDKKPKIKEGDFVLYSKYGGSDFPYNGKDYLMMRESDIYGVINK